MKISVILSTYNSPLWLEKVFWGYDQQTHKKFEIIIADDGSTDSTRELIEKYRGLMSVPIIHVWHPDEGFQKSAILNKAIKASSTGYLLFSDGDCIPRQDFVETHIQNLKPGYFLSGGCCKLPMETSQEIERDDIASGRAFQTQWLYQHGLMKTYKTLKLTSQGLQQRLLNLITTNKITWNGHNSSGWKQDILAVNGFNEEMQYGGQDRELGERLINYGIKGLQIRYSAICLHLDHKRGYATEESIKKNQKIRFETRRLRKMWTPSGIVKSSRENLYRPI